MRNPRTHHITPYFPVLKDTRLGAADGLGVFARLSTLERGGAMRRGERLLSVMADGELKRGNFSRHAGSLLTNSGCLASSWFSGGLIIQFGGK
jgi:hypothetical protein